MSAERIWTFRVRHIIEAIEKILRYTTGMTIDQFRDDERTIDAVIRNFLVVGETTRHVPSGAREAHPEIPWRLMEGMRHVLVHDYDDRAGQSGGKLTFEFLKKSAFPPLKI